MSKLTRNLIGFAAGLVATTLAVKKTDQYLAKKAKDDKLLELQEKALANTKYSKLPRLTFNQLEEKIKNGDNFIAYFAWEMLCPDAVLFQLYAFDRYLNDEEYTRNIFVVNLDLNAKDALYNKILREPLTQRFLIDTWTKDEIFNPMFLKSPMLVHYKDGQIKDLLAETDITRDEFTGLNEQYLNDFFNKIKVDF